MSLYNALFGSNPLSVLLLRLAGIDPAEVARDDASPRCWRSCARVAMRAKIQEATERGGGGKVDV